MHRGVEALVDAAPDFPDNWSLVFMGWGNLKEDLEIKALSYGFTKTLNERVCFIDGVPQDELALWTAGATLGAIPYENTGLNHLYCTPNKLWEYPLSGVPILASDLEEMGQTLRRHNIGVLIPREFTKEDIVNTINNIDDDALDTMKEACDVYARANNWQVLEHHLLGVYERIENSFKDKESKDDIKYKSTDNIPKMQTGTVKSRTTANHAEAIVAHKSQNHALFDKDMKDDQLKQKMRVPEKIKTILRPLTRRIFPHSSLKGQINSLNREKTKLDLKALKLADANSNLNQRNLILKDKLNEVRTLYKEEASKNRSVLDTAKLEKQNALLNERIEKLKDQLFETREKLKYVRVDQRDISPIYHNTSTAMDDFFEKDDAEEPYENFGEALKALLSEKHISFDGKKL